MTTPTHARCASCNAELIPQALWNAADAGDRRQWRREGRKKADGSHCASCRQAQRRKAVGRSDRPARTCTDCSTPITAPKRRLCDVCRDARAVARAQLRLEQSRAARAAERAARDDASDRNHFPSPDELLDGRWVLCPRTHVQKWTAA